MSGTFSTTFNFRLSERNVGEVLEPLLSVVGVILKCGFDVIIDLSEVSWEDETSLNTLCGRLGGLHRMSLSTPHNPTLVLATVPSDVSDILRSTLEDVSPIMMMPTMSVARTAILLLRTPAGEAPCFIGVRAI